LRSIQTFLRKKFRENQDHERMGIFIPLDYGCSGFALSLFGIGCTLPDMTDYRMQGF